MLSIGNYVKVTGFPVKNDNDIFIVTNQYSNGEYCLHKVKANGEQSKTKYNILFLNQKHFNNNSLKIEAITKEQLKQAKKEVKNFLNGITEKEIIHSFTTTNKAEIKQGACIKVIKPFNLTSSMYAVPKGFIYECTSEGDEKTNFLFHLLGKRGEKLSTYNASATNKILLGFKPATVRKLINENYIIVVDKITQTKKELKEAN